MCDIFGQLDNQNLAKYKEVSVTRCSFINSEKIWWVRIIQKYTDEDIIEDPNFWRKVIKRTPFVIVHDLGIASSQFYKRYQSGKHWSPLHIAVHSGHLQLCMRNL